jgi:inosine triphosphate pyrophosphatase
MSGCHLRYSEHMKHPIFITGNQDKADYLSHVLGIKLEHQKLSLDEIQSADSAAVAEHKARQAYGILKKPVLIEDSYLNFNALNGLPGPFVKFFYETTDGLEMMCRMLDGFDDRSAYTGAVYCYFDGNETHTFNGKLDGSISQKPCGVDGYGWDKIFRPAGHNGLTIAEMSPEASMELHNGVAGFKALRDFLLI